MYLNRLVTFFIAFVTCHIIWATNPDLEKLIEKARQNDIEAQVKLGNLYFYGKEKGTPQNYPLAFKWYKTAAEQGDIRAIFNLALCYDNGLGIEKNSDHALSLYQKVADKGVAAAQLNTAILLENRGEKTKAAKYYLKAINQNNPQAMWRYGKMLQKHEKPAIVKQAQTFFEKAVKLDHAPSKFEVADFLILHNKSPKRAFTLLESAVKNQLPKAFGRLGFCYEKGLGTEKSLNRASEQYERGAYCGDAVSQASLGLMLMQGKGAEKDPKSAFQWFEKSALQNNPVAIYNLGVCYAIGTPVEKNDKKAFEYFEKAAQLGHIKAQYNTGLLFEEGRGITKSEVMAFYWYKKAAVQNDPQALLAVAECHRDGIGTKIDSLLAEKFFKKADKALKKK